MKKKWYEDYNAEVEEQLDKDRENFLNGNYAVIDRSLYDVKTLISPDGERFENCALIPASGWGGILPEKGEPFILGSGQLIGAVGGWTTDPPPEFVYELETYVEEEGD